MRLRVPDSDVAVGAHPSVAPMRRPEAGGSFPNPTVPDRF